MKMLSPSNLIRKEQCPACANKGKDRSKDNLGVYSDGHTFCFSCGFGNSSISRIHNISRHNDKISSKQYGLAYDSSFNYPQRALEWIEQYELNRNDLLSHNVVWSEFYKRLIFPVYGEQNELLAYQGRYFGDDAKAVKWWGEGPLNEIFNILGECSKTLVLVEDIISAIKVSKLTQCMPLYGSAISVNRFKRLFKLYGKETKVVIWLDKDKSSEGALFRRRGTLLGLSCTTIISTKDPKEYSYEEIREYLSKV